MMLLRNFGIDERGRCSDMLVALKEDFLAPLRRRFDIDTSLDDAGVLSWSEMDANSPTPSNKREQCLSCSAGCRQIARS